MVKQIYSESVSKTEENMKKRTRQEDEEVLFPSAKRSPTSPDPKHDEQDMVEDVQLTTVCYDINGQSSYRSPMQEVSSDSEADNDDDDDDDDDDDITITIHPACANTSQVNATAVRPTSRNDVFTSSPKFDVEGILRLYDKFVLYDFK